MDNSRDQEPLEESEALKKYIRIANDFEKLLNNTPASQYDLPTPCSDWNISALIRHVFNTHFSVASQATELEAPQANPNNDLGQQWETAKTSIIELLANPDSAAKVISGMFGTQSFESLAGNLLCADLLFHTWDLAKATGQDDLLDVDAMAQTLSFLEPLDEAIRRPGGFAPKITPSEGDDLQTKFLNFGGRSINWSA